MYLGGGFNGSAKVNTIDYISIATVGNASSFGALSVSRNQLSATSNGSTGRGILAGGISTIQETTIDYITIASGGSAVVFGVLSTTNYRLSATSNGTLGRGIFAGGYSGSYLNTINYITISTLGNTTSFGQLTIARWDLAATSNGIDNRGVFGGGVNGTNPYISSIEYLTLSTLGNGTSFGTLTTAKSSLAATSNGTNNRGVFGGGYIANPPYYINTIDFITISTTSNAFNFGTLTMQNDYCLAATSNSTGDRGVFGGGYASSAVTNKVDFITISTVGNATSFGTLTVARDQLAATSNS